MTNTKRYTKKRKMKGGSKLNVYKLSPCGIASGGVDPFFLQDNIVANQSPPSQRGGWKLDDVGGRLSAKKKRSKRKGTRSKYFKNAKSSGKSRKTMSKSKKNTTTKNTTKYRTTRHKRDHKKTVMSGGGGMRNPLIGHELQLGLYGLWNTGKQAMHTWNGVETPYSDYASPIKQPINVT